MNIANFKLLALSFLTFSALIPRSNALEFAGKGDDFGKGGSVKVDKMTTYYPLEGGPMEGGCHGGGGKGMDPCQHLLDDALSGKAPCVVAATQRSGGSAALYGCKTQVPQLTQAVGKPVTVCFADVYAQSQSADVVGHSKFDVAMNRSSPNQSKVAGAGAGSVPVSCDGRTDGTLNKDRGVDRDPDAKEQDPAPTAGASSPGGGSPSGGGSSNGNQSHPTSPPEHVAPKNQEFAKHKVESKKPIQEIPINGTKELVKGKYKRELSDISDGANSDNKKSGIDRKPQVSYAKNTGSEPSSGESHGVGLENISEKPAQKKSNKTSLPPSFSPSSSSSGSSGAILSGGNSGSLAAAQLNTGVTSSPDEANVSTKTETLANNGEDPLRLDEIPMDLRNKEPIESLFGIEEEEGRTLFQRIHDYLKFSQKRGDISAKY